MTIYSDLWYKLITTPRYDKRIADRLRRAHNHAIQRRMKFAADICEGVEVSELREGQATGLRTTWE